MDVSSQDRDDTLELLAADSTFLASLHLIDYSLLVLKIRDLGEGEVDDAYSQAL